MHWFAIRAIGWRQLQQLLANPVSYIFLLVLSLVAGSILFLPVSFYTRNICDVQALVVGMPWLASIFIPCIAMNSWAGERELHTDEALLTLPLSIADAIIGKWLGLCLYWCIALLVTLSNIVVLSMLGDPDSGLIIAHYTASAAHGFILCAVALGASCLVSIPAVACIIGCLLCSATTYLLIDNSWFDHFNRGRLHLSSLLMALTLSAAFLCCSILILSSKRWQRSQKSTIIKQMSIAVISLICLFNISIIGLRSSAAIDITEEQLSTLSDESLQIIKEIDQEIHIHAFVQDSMPNPYHLKSEEVINILGSIDNCQNPNIHIHLHRPQSVLDTEGQIASKHYGIKTQRIAVSDMVGGLEQDVFLGVALQCGVQKQVIPFIELGMPVEFQIIRSLHTLNKKRLPVLGIVSNDFPLLAHHDYRSDRMRRESPIVSEWRNHFEVVEISLYNKLIEKPDILVVAMPSGLSQQEMDHLLLYLSQGGKALLLEDPAPMWSEAVLAPSFSRKQLYQSRGLPVPVNISHKGNMDNFYHALGVHVPSAQILWSDDNPSHKLRQMWPPSIVWSMKNRQAIADNLCTTGIESVLFPFPGQLYGIPDGQTTITPLLSTAQQIAWGTHQLSEYVSYAEGTGFRHHKPTQYNALEQPYAIIAAQIRGPVTLPASTVALEAEEQQTPSSSAVCDIILVADTDFIHDQFHELHTKSQPDFNEDDLAIVRHLQNFDFINNCLDVLAGDTKLLPIRTRQLKYRSLHFIEDIQRQKERYKEQVFKTTRDNTLAEQEKAQDFKNKLLADVAQRSDLNETGKQQLYQAQLESGKAAFEEQLITIKRQEAEHFKDAELRYRNAINLLLDQIRWYALAVPAALLSLLALCIFAFHYVQERSLIPGQRLRDKGE